MTKEQLQLTTVDLENARIILKQNNVWLDLSMMANYRPDLDLGDKLWKLSDKAIEIENYIEKQVYIEAVDTFFSVKEYRMADPSQNNDFKYVTILKGSLQDSELYQLYLSPFVVNDPNAYVIRKSIPNIVIDDMDDIFDLN